MLQIMRELEDLLASGSAGLSSEGLLALGVIMLAALLLAIALLKVGDDYRLSLRPLPACQRLIEAIGEAAESGKSIHLSAGTGAVGAAASADTLAGVNAIASLAGRAATARAKLLVTTASPLVLPLLQAASEQAYANAGVPAEYDPGQVRFAGDDRNAYAVAVADSLYHENISDSLLLGSLGDETLFIGERGRNAGVTQVIGTPSTRALPYAVATADAVIVGEETYAAAAYLSRRPAHLASLLVQDWLRLLVVGAIIAGAISKTMGW